MVASSRSSSSASSSSVSTSSPLPKGEEGGNNAIPQEVHCTQLKTTVKTTTFKGHLSNEKKIYLLSKYNNWIYDTSSQALNSFPIMDEPYKVDFFGSVLLEHSQKILCFGGRKEKGRSNEMLAYDIVNKSWRRLDPGAAGSNTAEWPSPRSSFVCVLRNSNSITASTANSFHHLDNPQTMVICGGINNNGNVIGETWEYHVGEHKWRKLPECPVTCYGQSAVLRRNEDCMYMFGGALGQSNLISDLYSYNFKTKEWKEIDTKGRKPVPRMHVGTVLTNNERQMVLFGGETFKEEYLNDVFIFDFDTSTYHQLNLVGEIPTPVYGPLAVIMDQVIYLFGGLVHGKADQIPMTQLRLVNTEDAKFQPIEIQPQDILTKVGEKLFKKKLNCDLVVQLQGTEFKCHKCILSHSAPMLKLIQSQTTEGNGIVYLKFEDSIHPSHFQYILQFLYGMEDLPHQDNVGILDIILFCKKYEFNSFADWILKELRRQVHLQQKEQKQYDNYVIRQNNVIDLLYNSEAKKVDEVYQLCLEMIKGLKPQDRIQLTQNEIFTQLPRKTIQELFQMTNQLMLTQKSISELYILTIPLEDNAVLSPKQLFEKHIQTLYNLSVTSDLILVSSTDYHITQKKYNTHRAILSSISDFFQCKFSGAFNDSKISESEVAYDSQVIHQMLKFAYGSSIQIQGDPHLNKPTIATLMEMITFANMILFTELEDECAKALVDKISVFNIFEVIEFSKKVPNSILKEACKSKLVQLFSPKEIADMLYGQMTK